MLIKSSSSDETFKTIVSPLNKPRCFWGKQWQICLNKKKLLLLREIVKVIGAIIGDRDRKRAPF